MDKPTSKRQITPPQSVCHEMDLQPGDFVEVFARDGVAHVVKMSACNLAGKFHPLTKVKVFPNVAELHRAMKKRNLDPLLASDGSQAFSRQIGRAAYILNWIWRNRWCF